MKAGGLVEDGHTCVPIPLSSNILLLLYNPTRKQLLNSYRSHFLDVSEL